VLVVEAYNNFWNTSLLGEGITTLSTSNPFSLPTDAATSTASFTELTSPVKVTQPFPPIA